MDPIVPAMVFPARGKAVKPAEYCRLGLVPVGVAVGEQRRASRPALLVSVALVCAIAAACASSAWRLAKLQSDPMATYALPGAVDTRATEFEGGTSGVSSPSRVRRSFTVPAGGAEAAIEEIAIAATEAGWELTPREPNGFTGHKKIDGMDAQIFIAAIVQDDTVWFELSSRAT